MADINNEKTGPITVVHRFTWKNIDPLFLKACIEHTLRTNNNTFLHTETDRGPTWLLKTFWLRAPTGVEWTVTCDPSTPRHFAMSTAADLAAHRAELAEDERFFADAAQFDKVPA